MKRFNMLLIGIGPALGIVLAFCTFSYLHRLPSPYLMPISADMLIDSPARFQSNPSARYTLVEFGDYLCPVCENDNHEIAVLLLRHAHNLRFDFRHNPVHRNYEAAILAECARRQERFWPVHDYLFQQHGRLASNAKEIANCLQLDETKVKRDRHAALKAVERDIELAKRLGVSYTPTFMLCLPNQKVLWLYSLQQVDALVP